jgi:hypothetical protein
VPSEARWYVVGVYKTVLMILHGVPAIVWRHGSRGVDTDCTPCASGVLAAEGVGVVGTVCRRFGTVRPGADLRPATLDQHSGT